MRKSSISAFVSLLVYIAALTPAFSQQKQDMRFEHLTTENGLSSNQTTIIIKDKRGFVWIGTADAGLNRFDGIHIKTYKADTLNKNALRNDFISCLIEDKEGKLWVGQFDQGICLFDPLTEKFKLYKHDDNDPKSLSKGFINSVYEDRECRIWITAYGGGLNLYDKKNDNFIHYSYSKDSPTGSINNNSLRDIKQDKNGLFWIASFGKDNDVKSRIQIFDANTGKFHCLDFTSYIDDEGKEIKIPPRGTDIVNRIYIDDDDNIWFASYVGAMKYDVKSKK